jgi:hypothetical protein
MPCTLLYHVSPVESDSCYAHADFVCRVGLFDVYDFDLYLYALLWRSDGHYRVSVQHSAHLSNARWIHVQR